MFNIKDRYSAASVLFMDLIASYPLCSNIAEYHEVHQRHLDITRNVALNQSPTGLMEMYIEAVLDFDNAINSMTPEERLKLKRPKINLEDLAGGFFDTKD